MKLQIPRGVILAVVAIRFVVGIVALPLAPFLYREHFIVLVLMRPTKEVLLAAGFLVRADKVSLLPVLLAAIPLVLVGVWVFFYLGREYRKEISDGEIPGIGGRVVQPKKVQKVQKVLDKRGPRLVFLGRLAVLSSAMVAAAAGAGKMKLREFLPVDAAGGLLSVAITVGAGYVMGEAYDEAGPWLSVLGVAALIAAGVLLGRYLRKV
jgi:membrane-associated protein